MSRGPLTEDQVTVAIVYSMMSAYNFKSMQRKEWEAYGAKFTKCPTCGSPPFTRCYNMVDIKYNLARAPEHWREVRLNNRAHPDRINWKLILNGMKQRGYYHPQIETNVRNQVRG